MVCVHGYFWDVSLMSGLGLAQTSLLRGRLTASRTFYLFTYETKAKGCAENLCPKIFECFSGGRQLKPGRLLGIEHRQVRDLALKFRAEGGGALSLGLVAQAMGHGAQTAALLARQAEGLVDDHARHDLTIALTHQARLVCVDGEALLEHDATCKRTQLQRRVPVHLSRKGKIVRVARIDESPLSRQAGEATVEATVKNR
ncbi:hypothetical protein SBV1_1500014 [Verrucomicrobia bacterium]|nr:hypothetical protein SBV1_1500014 [Verrucomicrobiota bacterium]